MARDEKAEESLASAYELARSSVRKATSEALTEGLRVIRSQRQPASAVFHVRDQMARICKVVVDSCDSKVQSLVETHLRAGDRDAEAIGKRIEEEFLNGLLAGHPAMSLVHEVRGNLSGAMHMAADASAPVIAARSRLAQEARHRAAVARLAHVEDPPARGRELPPELGSSLEQFKRDYPSPKRTAFIMMQFANTKAHTQIVQAIRDALKVHGIDALRADDKEYHQDLFPNILTYIHGCEFGIAVFERIEADDFNPNVSLEVGYMLALPKPVCLLKERTLKTLHSDLVGKLYRSFEVADPSGTISEPLTKWLQDKELVPKG